ncbi:PKD domain-containing protein [Ferruginibacter lapsinanis]|uniref:IgGFc-binding protein n=1 Tax=Ferruginibacter lapsinanis TaxID=563172 RepID=UPI001E3B214E|nr:IgGFc-binding protein [Ferruginibacter lapsinanis]UEG51216.1 PKD domain-containing protein [Ferruginibacter lapsinanis]
MKRLLPLLISILFISAFPLFSNAQCHADFILSSNTTCSNGAIQVTNISTSSGDTINKVIWYWGDGKSDTILNHSDTIQFHNYFRDSSYSIFLKIYTKLGCTDSVTHSFDLSIKPQVAFAIGAQTTNCGYNTINFTSESTTSTGDSLSLLWKFSDDNSTASTNTYNKKYYNHGAYSVSLIVSSSNGCADILSKQVSIYSIPKAAFKVNNGSICIGDSASMSITEMSAPANSYFLKKVWYFGDGSSYVDPAVVYTTVKHKYKNPGKYIVTLLYQTSTCNIYYYDSIEVKGSVVPGFTQNAETLGLCGYQKINFTNLTVAPDLPIAITYKWKFNNTYTDTAMNPSFIYTANGTYPVSLTASFVGGCPNTLDTTITVSGMISKPKASFTFETDTLNLLKLNFFDSTKIDSSTTITGYTWNFGDGTNTIATTNKTVSHVYPMKGSYTVKLVITSANGCMDSLTRNISVDSTPVAICNPLFLAPSNVCLGVTTTFVDSSYLKNGTDTLLKQIWDFGDGKKDTIYNNFYYSHPHLYAASGLYSVSLTIFTKRGCSSSLTKTTGVRSLSTKADFTYTQIPNCSVTNQNIQLNGTVSNYTGNLVVKWLLGDGYTESIINPIHNYAPGNYTVKFLSRVSSCQSTYDTLTKIIKVLPKSKADFTYSFDNTNTKTILFEDHSVYGFNNITQMSWDFGDGTSSTETNPAHTYPGYGNYTVKHSFVSDNAACVPDTIMYTIQIDSFKTLPDNVSLSSMGTEFWAGYGYIENMRRKGTDASRPYMSLYLAASENPATVLVDIPNMPISKKSGSGFPKVVYIPAKSVVEVTGFPIGDPNDIYNQNDQADTRLYFTGITDRAIRITSNQPIGAWEHVYATNNTAGGSLLIPTKMWSTSYIVQSRGGSTNTQNPNSFFFVIAESDSTIIEFTPSADILDSSTATLFTQNHTAANVLYKAGVTYTKLLNKGEVFNAMGFISGVGSAGVAVDLSGTRIVSNNPFKRIAVFGGNGRVLINAAGCSNTAGSDNLIQQIFPKAAWGTKYLTAPTKTMETGIYRITVDDTATNVLVNKVPLLKSSIINQSFYEISRNQPLLIESDKRIMVTQYIVTPGCPNYTSGNNGSGDPEMINLSPLKYGTKNATIFSPNYKSSFVAASASYVNVIIRKEGVASFKIDNTSLVDTSTSSYLATGAYGSSALISMLNAFKPFPGDTDYSYAQIKVTTGATHTLESDSSFVAIAYGMGNGETVGYNVGFNFNTLPVRYQYLGTGDWTNSINWLGNKIPPNPLPMGSEIIISGNCTMNVPQTIEDGARMVVEEGGKLTINGNLLIQK